MKKRAAIFVSLFLLYVTLAVVAIYGTICFITTHYSTSDMPPAGAGSDGVVQVWEGLFKK